MPYLRCWGAMEGTKAMAGAASRIREAVLILCKKKTASQQEDKGVQTHQSDGGRRTRYTTKFTRDTTPM